MRRFRSACLTTLMFSVMALAGCESSITRENFARIQKGMTLAEVQTILGGSGEEDSSPAGMTISGAGVAGSSKESKEKTYVWKDGNATIIVTFVDGKVVEARESGL